MLFSEVIGQDAVKQQLIHSGKEGRVSHSLLFFGPKGSGTLPMALAFAQYLNCENPGLADSCGICSSCIKSQKMVHPDIHYVYPIVTVKDILKPKSIDFISEWRSCVLSNPYLDNNDWLEAIVGDSNKQGFIPAEESNEIVPRGGDFLANGDMKSFGASVDRSQLLAEKLLGNQTPETVELARSARAIGAAAASAFGAGFGGSVWALVSSSRADIFS